MAFAGDRIARARERFRAFWLGEDPRAVVSIYEPPAYRQEPDADRMVAGAVAAIEADLAGGEEEILPCFWPDFGTISTAKMWGGKVMPPRDAGCIHIEPAARSVAELEGLSPCAFEESDFQRAIDLYRRVCDRLGTGDVFVRTPDFQGPMNTLALVLDQTELLCGLAEAPDAIHAMLDRVTDVLVASVRRFCDEVGPEKVVGNIWPYVCLPATMGVCLTQDYMPLLGPGHYAEFELPRLRRIAEAFGGVFIHCCGTYRQHLANLRRGNFRIWGLEFAYPQMTPMDAYAVFGDEIAYLVGVSPDGEARFPTIVDYARYLATTECARARFWFAACRGVVDVEELRRVVTSGFGRG